jgi:hypothetical protein
MMRSRRFLVCAGLALACGGSPPPPAATSNPSDTTQVASADASDARRVPSEALRRHWTLGDDVAFAVYADVGGLMKTEVFAGLVPALLSRDEMIPDAGQRECLKAVIGSARELVSGGDGKRALTLIQFEPSLGTAAAAECISRAMSLNKVAFDGASQAFGDDRSLLVATPDILVFGSAAEVKKSLAGNADGAWLDLALRNDQYLACRLATGSDARGSCALTITPELLSLAVRLDLPSEEAAKSAAGALGGFIKAAAAQGGLRGLSYDQKGSRLDVAFEARGSAPEQAQQIGVVAALAIHGVRKYLQNAKQTEARVNVVRIATAYATSHSTGKKLFSLPAVPKEIPRGMKVQTAPEDWKAWQSIGFAVEGPQYYQYEVVAAPNGKSAEIIARGDLDADGQSSKLVFRVELFNGVAKLDERMEEIDLDE